VKARITLTACWPGQGLQQRLQFAVGGLVLVAAEGHGQLADALHQLEGLDAFLLADHVPEDPAQQPDVLHQRAFVFLGAPDGRLLGGRHRGLSFLGTRGC
jgi:hypothetical protein